MFEAVLNKIYPSLEKKRSQVVTTDLEIFPSPEVSKFERGDWSLEILNGSGIPGLAKEVADKLTDSGYEVAKTGNAPDGNYQGNQVFINKNFLNKKDQFMEDIKVVMQEGSYSFIGELADSTSSAKIILGKE